MSIYSGVKWFDQATAASMLFHGNRERENTTDASGEEKQVSAAGRKRAKCNKVMKTSVIQFSTADWFTFYWLGQEGCSSRQLVVSCRGKECKMKQQTPDAFIFHCHKVLCSECHCERRRERKVYKEKKSASDNFLYCHIKANGQWKCVVWRKLNVTK